MKQFNLLLVSKSPGVSGDMLKSSSRIFRKSFVLQAEDMVEAESLLKRLSINLLLIDMDQEQVHFKSLNQAFPNLLIIGMTNRPSDQMVPADPVRNRILLKRDIATSLPVELKAIRKDKGYASTTKPKRRIGKSAESNDFKNFVRLVPSR